MLKLESNRWLLTDEIDLSVAQEKLKTLREIEELCIKLNLIKRTT